MKNLPIYITAIILAVAATLLTQQFSASTAVDQNQISTPSERESIYKRVLRTETIRCGYLTYPPEIVVDSQTNQISGWVYEIIEAAAKELNFKVEWVEQVTHDSMFQGLQTGRYDVICSGLWESPPRSKVALFMTPVTYATYYPFVRADDTRFDNDLRLINSEDVKIAVADGEYGEVVAREKFPSAGLHSIPPGTSYSLIFPDVATGKADVVFALPSTASHYMKNNPGKLKMIDQEVLVMPSSVMSTNVGEHKLKYLLDSTLRHLLNTGVVANIIAKYHPGDDKTNYPVARPYQEN